MRLDISSWDPLSDSRRLPKGPRKRKSITGLKKLPKRQTAPRAVAKVLSSAQLKESPQKIALSSCLQVESPIQKSKKKSIARVRSRRPIRAKTPSAATTDASFTTNPRGSPHHTSRKPLPSLPPIQAQIRYISQITVQKKWSPAPKPAEGNIQIVLQLVERSVVGRLPGDMAKIAAQKAIKPVAETLGP